MIATHSLDDPIPSDFFDSNTHSDHQSGSSNDGMERFEEIPLPDPMPFMERRGRFYCTWENCRKRCETRRDFKSVALVPSF